MVVSKNDHRERFLINMYEKITGFPLSYTYKKMTRNIPRHRWSTTARQIGELSRAKRNGSPIALSVYKNVVVSGDDDRDQLIM